MSVIQFSYDDMQLFEDASHDKSPIHVSAEYARRTPFGERVVWGVFSTLAAIGRLPERTGQTLESAAIEFRNPMFANCQYQVTASETSPSQCRAKIFEGTRLMLSATFKFKEDPDSGNFTAPTAATCQNPASWTEAELLPGLSVEGIYAPSPEAFGQLIERWDLRGKGVSPLNLAALLWSSYMVGMELPGERAAFTSLKISFTAARSCNTPFRYVSTVVEMDDRFGRLATSSELRILEAAVAHVESVALVRAASPSRSLEALTARLPQSDRLAEKTALVIGGSRGLGAAIAAGLALQGATVFLNYHRCHDEAQSVQASLPPTCGPVVLAQGDASDPIWCREVQDKIRAEYGGLDILVCSASPAIRSMDFAPDTIERLMDFSMGSLRLVAMPMAQFLPELASRNGSCIVISSEYARTAHIDFPHYVAAKCAIEGLVRAMAERYKDIGFLVPRPPKLLTDTNNTPMGRTDAMEAEQVAAAILNHLCRNVRTQPVEFMETF